MGLSNELIAQFVKATKDDKNTKSETTVYGTVVESNGTKYVQLDGSELLTPISTTADVRPGERVTVLIKNHSATITGNMSSPAARVDDLEDTTELGKRITEVEILVADKVSTDDFDAQTGRIDSLVSDNVLIKEGLFAAEGDIENLQTNVLNVTETLTAAEADISKLQTDKLDASVAKVTYATIKDLDATNVDVHNLEATYGEFADLTTSRLDAINANISNLNTDKLSAETASITYANIDFSNIGKAAMEYFYSQSGLIDNVVVGDQTITGNLVGVTISGDLIEGNTIKAEKLVIKGSDGLYYKINTDGMKTEAEQTDQNSLNGSIIKAKSITASKISVTDLVAFGATIGGFNITSNSIYSGTKSTSNNTTRGIYLDNDGQVSFGDSDSFVKFYKDTDETYKLAISADSIMFGTNKKTIEQTIDDAAKTATNFMSYDSSGLQVGNKLSGSWSGFRTQIASSAFNILDAAGTVLASYGAKLIELGKNATDAVIKFCGGKGQIEYDSDEDYLQITGDNVRIKGNSISSLYTTYYDGSHTAEKTSVNSTPQGVHIYAQKSIDIDPDTMAGNWTTSEVSVTPEAANTLADNVNVTSRYGTTINSVSGDVTIEPLDTTNIKSKIYVTNPGADLKTAYNDGIPGWYIGGDGTMHATRATSGAYIGFHYANSGPTTSYIKESTSGTININGMDYGVNKHLWSGSNYMNAAQSITLSAAISSQANGIVLIWSYFSNGAAEDYNFHFHFIPKWFISKYAGKGADFALANHTGNVLGHKYLYIADTKITGNDYNDNGTVNGTYATYINTAFVLRAVIGV